MVMGADVTHAAPQHREEKPSIVAVVASTEPAACNMSQASMSLSPFSTLVPQASTVANKVFATLLGDDIHMSSAQRGEEVGQFLTKGREVA